MWISCKNTITLGFRPVVFLFGKNTLFSGIFYAL